GHDGVALTGSLVWANLVQGNYIGLNAAGTAAIANSNQGVQIYSAAINNTIGGSSSGRNVISGNANQGIVLSNAGTTGNLIAGNYIGLTAAGTAAVPNVSHGVLIIGSPQNNTIGTNCDGVNDANEGNVISGNGQRGIVITDAADGTSTVSPHTTGNVIAGN